jgi:hypothetical protein
LAFSCSFDHSSSSTIDAQSLLLVSTEKGTGHSRKCTTGWSNNILGMRFTNAISCFEAGPQEANWDISTGRLFLQQYQLKLFYFKLFNFSAHGCPWKQQN